MNSSLRIYSFIMLLGLLVSSVAMAKEEPPKVTEDGLHLKEDSKFGLVYINPDAVFTGYRRIILLEPYIAFKKDWKRDQNRSARGARRVSDKTMEDISTRLAAEFNIIFAEVLEENDGYELVEETGEDVLILRPAIINLDVTAPDLKTSGRSTTYAQSAGEMTLYLEVFDSLTNSLIGKAYDRGQDRQSSFLTWHNSATNTSAARRILRGWSETLREGLDEANSGLASPSSE